MSTTKPAIKSIGVLGPTVASAVVIANMAGYNVSDNAVALLSALPQITDNVLALVGIAAGLYGRWRATKPIKGLLK